MLPIRRNIALLSGAVAANTAMLQSERAGLLGFNDLVSGATGAGLTLLGGVALTAGGVAPLAIAAVVLVTVPALWILRGRPRCHAWQLDDGGTRRCTSARGWLNLEATR